MKSGRKEFKMIRTESFQRMLKNLNVETDENRPDVSQNNRQPSTDPHHKLTWEKFKKILLLHPVV